MNKILPPETGSAFTETIHSQVPAKLNPASQTLPSPFVVVVTGASRGIGAHTAMAFAQAGATGIIITARKAQSLAETKKACEDMAKSPELKVSIVEAEAGRDEAAAERIAATVQKEHGRLDLLVNNAGGIGTDVSAMEPLYHKATTEQVTGPMDIVYIGRVLTFKHLAPILLASPNGAKTMVNISSVGSHMPSRAPLGYSLAALASNRLVETTAERYRGEGLLAYSVHPGAVNSTPPDWVPAWLLANSKDAKGLCGAFLVWLVAQRREWLSGRYLDSTWDVDELVSKKEEIVEGNKLRFRMTV